MRHEIAQRPQLGAVPVSGDIVGLDLRESALPEAPVPLLARERDNERQSYLMREPDYRAQILASIECVEASDWDRLVGDSAIARTHAYLRAIEGAGIEGCDYFYVRVRDRNESVVAQACVYLVTTDFAQLLPSWLHRPVAGLRRLWPALLTARITECATPLVAGTSISLAEGANRVAAVACIERAMSTLAAREGSRLLVMRDFLAPETGALEFLKTRGYKCVSNLPLARIRVRWRSYEEYLGAMRARYRKDLRRRLQRAERSGRTVEAVNDFGASAAHWNAQANFVQARTRAFKREALTSAYYTNIDTLLGEHSVLLAVNEDGRYIAHGMVLFDEEQTIATFFGRDAGAPGGEWFQLINAVIRLGIERGSRYISLGLGSYDAKSLVGAEVEPLFVYTRCTNRLLNVAIRLVPDLMRANHAPQRRLFRD